VRCPKPISVLPRMVFRNRRSATLGADWHPLDPERQPSATLAVFTEKSFRYLRFDSVAQTPSL
jgi:hypothetical protein